MTAPVGPPVVVCPLTTTVPPVATESSAACTVLNAVVPTLAGWLPAVVKSASGIAVPNGPLNDGETYTRFAALGPFRGVSWRNTFPGAEEIRVETGDTGMPARLFRLAPGGVVPRHAHVGEEVSLVLAGGFTDDEGHFGRGDVSIRGDDRIHRQLIDPGEPCVVLVVADAPFRPRSLRALAASWIGRF